MHKVFPLGSEGNLHQSALNMIGKAKCHFAMTCALQRSFEDHISLLQVQLHKYVQQHLYWWICWDLY